MNEMLDSNRIAQSIAKLILHWHQTIGTELIQSDPPEYSDHYLSTLEELRALDIALPASMTQIANAQIGGQLERFYGHTISVGLWQEIVGTEPVPHDLGAAAKLLVRLLKQNTNSFKFPDGWEDDSLLLSPEYVTHFASTSYDPTESYRIYFLSLSLLEEKMIGGRNLMVSMNEDVPHETELEDGEIEVYNPPAFYFELATGESSLVSLVLQNIIELEYVSLREAGDAPQINMEDNSDGTGRGYNLEQ